jgi:hypothetical protein
MDTSFPVFKSGQVLTSKHLNDLVAYLEQQDRLTRNKVIGVGIVCGLEVDYEPKSNRIRITQGCAVTSEGYVITQDACVLNQFREYTLPVPFVEEVTESMPEGMAYPLFMGEGGGQIPLWELLPTDHVPASGEPKPSSLNATFVSNKVVMLFLECNLESLRNCDINDCSDKGERIKFTLRKLLVSKDDAQVILKQEAKLAQRPVDRHSHPRQELAEIQIEKINPSAHNIDTFSELFGRITTINADVAPQLLKGLQQSYKTYRYMLEPLYPATTFPDGPFADPQIFNHVLSQLRQNLFLVQFFYDFIRDLVESYNEFLREARCVEAECCPNSDRFPKHVFLGEVKPKGIAPVVKFSSVADVSMFNPLSANADLGPQERPTAYRHHFIPSPLFDRQGERLKKVQAFHYRTYLLILRYQTEDLFQKDIRITPSVDGNYSFSDKAIPYYYAFEALDDLHRNWSFDKTEKNRLGRVFSHLLVDQKNHPLKFSATDQNFYRVEGIIGKPLRQVMREVTKQKRELGLSFAVEPVFVSLTEKDDLSSRTFNQEAQARAKKALLTLLLCRMRDLDVIFLVLIAALFYYLLSIVSLLSKVNTTQLAQSAVKQKIPLAASEARLETTRTAAASPAAAGVTPASGLKINVNTKTLALKVDRKESEALLQEIRPFQYQKGLVTEKVTTGATPQESIGKLYAQIKDAPTTENLFDRTVEFAKTLDATADPTVTAQKIYPTVSLLDKTEELIEVASVASLAELDTEKFSRKYDGFVSAYQGYVDKVDIPEEESNSEIGQTNYALRENFNAVAATGPQAVIGNLGAQLTERTGNFFKELLLEGYAKRHPGMEHKGGVPVGGTLVLLYTHQNFIAQVLGQNRTKIDASIQQVHSRYVGGAKAGASKDPRQVLVAPKATGDPLDDFVVLGDFCLPYLCCDTDCSELEVPPASRTEPEPSVVGGAVFGQAATGRTATNPTLIANASVEVIDVDRKTTIPVEMSKGNYSFKAMPGTYRLEAQAPRFTTQTRIVTVGAGGSVKEDFVLTVGA